MAAVWAAIAKIPKGVVFATIVPTRPIAALKTASGRSRASLSFMPMSAIPASTANTTTAGTTLLASA